MRSLSALQKISEVTSNQWGLISSSQALKLGLSKMNLSRLCEHGHLNRIRRGIYREASAPADKYEHIKAIWLSLKPEATIAERMRNLEIDFILTGDEAANIYEIGDYYVKVYTFLHNGRKQISDNKIKIHKCKVDRNKITIQQGLPTLRPNELLLDMLYEHHEPSLLSKAIDKAEYYHLIDVRQATNLKDKLRDR